MSESVDLRKAAADYHLLGHTLKETSEIFGAGKSTVSEWTKNTGKQAIYQINH